MDFEDDENDYFSANIAHTREKKCSQDMQHRPARKSPRKKHRTAGRSSLVIDQLKNGFRRDDLALPRMRVRRNWRLGFFMKHLRNNRGGRRDEERIVTLQQGRSRNLVLEAPRIYSIGLHSSATCTLNDRGDLSGDATRNAFKKRLNVIRRAMIVCKYYWIAQSSPPSSLSAATRAPKKHTDQEAMIIDRANSADASVSFEETPKCDECSEKNNDGHFLCDDCSLTFETVFPDDRPFKSDDFSAETDHEDDRFRVVRKDVEIQTSARIGGRQKKTRGKSKTVSERESLCRKYDKDKSILRPRRESFADFRGVDWYHSDERNRIEKSRLSARVGLQNKRAEYMNKFQAVSRQIEEITATLKETCYGDRNLRGNPEDCDEYSSKFMPDDAKTCAKRNFDKSELERILPKESTPKEKSDYERSCNNLQEISRIDYASNDETPIMRHNTAGFSINHRKHSDNHFSCDFATFTKLPIHPASKTFERKKSARDRVAKHQISSRLNLTKDQNETGEFSIEGETFSEIYIRNDPGIPESRRNEYGKMSTGSFVDIERSRSKKIVEEKMGERAILVDIKRRIDRDFDDFASVEKCANDVEEDFLAVSRKSSDFQNDRCDTTTEETIEESRSTPVLLTRRERTSVDTADIQIRDSTSAGAVSEYSNRNSTLSKYFSCTQFSSLISLSENYEDEHAFDDRDIRIARDASPSATLYSESNHYDLELLSSYVDQFNYSDSSPYNYANSNDGNFNSECTTPLDRSARDDKYAEEFLIETSFKRERDPDSELCDDEYFLGECNAEEKKPRARFEKRRTVDTTFDSASKSSRYIGSIDSGVFVNSSLIDFHPHEDGGFAGKSPAVQKQIRRATRLNESSSSGSDGSSYTDDTLDRRVDDVVRDLTKNLILCERRARTRLEEMKASSHRTRSFKFSRELDDAYHDLFDTARRSSEDDEERILSISTPSLLSLSDSQSDERM